MDARAISHDRMIMSRYSYGAERSEMSVHDSRTRAVASGTSGKSYEKSVNDTSTVFERTARPQTDENQDKHLHRTSSIFDWSTRREDSAHKQGENGKRTSMIFERPARQRPLENKLEDKGERAQPLQTPSKTVEPTPHPGSLETGANASPNLVGRTLAHKYTLESVIGTGSMGTIFSARQIALDKLVSIKILHRELAEQRNFVERFKLEAFSASRLEHLNSLRVLDFGADGDLLYLVMEYVEADDLLTVMQREWPFKEQRIVEIMCQGLAALAKAHEVGIVHRDIKPENILLLRGIDDEGNATDIVKVCDFGIAKMAGASAPQSRPFAPHLTTEGLVVGTPDYMSPEQARGEGVDGRSDLYSMGVVLYHLLAGRPPFIADTPFGIAIQHVSERPTPPSQHRVVHPALERICLHAMNKRPEDRFQTAREMRRALLSALDPQAEVAMTSAHATPPSPILAVPVRSAPVAAIEPPPVATSPPSGSSDSDWRRRPNVIVTAAALVVVLTLAVIALISRLRGESSSWDDENVVRTTTTTLVPTAPVTTPIPRPAPPAR
jgi:serine/threonine-protein kinase